MMRPYHEAIEEIKGQFERFNKPIERSKEHRMAQDIELSALDTAVRPGPRVPCSACVQCKMRSPARGAGAKALLEELRGGR